MPAFRELPCNLVVQFSFQSFLFDSKFGLWTKSQAGLVSLSGLKLWKNIQWQ